ncbi:MAG: uncharacterized protein KVP18_004077 [Porospora cf. gigantea A]|uniref:uncharacterized protein n=1 Tax=Porospora cf. gigantea A TaxID=2853593 RepID=UPI0035593803|nr:MAG: hypothetical protein KVP18_004077 [Porospora cf. gigantea A]
MDERSISDPHSIAVLLYKQSLIEAQAGNSDEAMSFYRQAKRLWSEIDSQLTRIEAEFKQEQLEPEPKRKQVDRSGGACWILDVPISVWIGHLSGLLDLPTLAYFSRTCRPLAQILTADGTWRELCRRDPRFTKGMIPSKQHYFSCTRPRSDGLYISRNSYTRRRRSGYR